MDETTCVHVAGFGFMDQMSFADWAENVIQDPDIAKDVANAMLNNPTNEYEWNTEYPPQNYMQFLIIDKDDFLKQMKVYYSD